jgi:hypothetical protein
MATDLNEEWWQFCQQNANMQSIRIDPSITSMPTKAPARKPTKAKPLLATSVSEAVVSASAVTATDPPVADSLALPVERPKCSPLYISTKTKICYLNKKVDLQNIFWHVPIMAYHVPAIGVVKKQMKFNCTSQAELDALLAEKAKCTSPLSENIITQVHPTSGRVKFKDVRKINVGLSRKDIVSFRSKQKKAFYNCFVLILRIFHDDVYREIHVKVFNTGKLEIPGIQDVPLLNNVLTTLINILTPHVVTEADPAPLEVHDGTSETVLINSNFTCGYYINRQEFYRILRFKYNINCNYEPCSYPGIQCEFYHDTSRGDQQTGCQTSATTAGAVTIVSFMIFRTGSVLIVGKCNEHVLNTIYNFLVRVFDVEFPHIFGGINTSAATIEHKELEPREDGDADVDDEDTVIAPTKRKPAASNSTRKIRRQLVTVD